MDSNVILMDLNQRVIKGIIMVYVMGYWSGFANLPGFVVQHEFGFFLGGLIWFQWDVSSFHQPTYQNGVSPTQHSW